MKTHIIRFFDGDRIDPVESYPIPSRDNPSWVIESWLESHPNGKVEFITNNE
jgi:hypothetical protein